MLKIQNFLESRLPVLMFISLSLSGPGELKGQDSFFPDHRLTDMSYFIWRDDFVGITLHPAYSAVTAGNGVIHASAHPSTTGWVHLEAKSPGLSSARLRLGDDDDDSLTDALPLSAKHHIRLETKAILDTTSDVDATIGLIAEDDPINVGGALLFRSDPKPQWIFQTCSDPTGRGRHDKTTCTTTRLDWLHKPAIPFIVRIEATRRYTRVLVNGKERARHTENLPVTSKQTMEYQIWNKAKSPHMWSSPSMFVSYLLVVQDR